MSTVWKTFEHADFSAIVAEIAAIDALFDFVPQTWDEFLADAARQADRALDMSLDVRRGAVKLTYADDAVVEFHRVQGGFGVKLDVPGAPTALGAKALLRGWGMDPLEAQWHLPAACEMLLASI